MSFTTIVRLPDFNIKYGESTSDKLAQVATIEELAASNVIATNFAPGTRVLVVPYTTAVVDADGNVTVDLDAAQANGDPGGYLLIGAGYALQGGFAVD